MYHSKLDSATEEEAAAYRVAIKSKSKAPKNIWSPSTSSNEGDGPDENNPEGLSSVFDEDSSGANMGLNVAPPTSSSTSGPQRTLAELSISPQQETVVERTGGRHLSLDTQASGKSMKARLKLEAGAEAEHANEQLDGDVIVVAPADGDYFSAKSGEVPLEEKSGQSVAQQLSSREVEEASSGGTGELMSEQHQQTNIDEQPERVEQDVVNERQEEETVQGESGEVEANESSAKGIPSPPSLAANDNNWRSFSVMLNPLQATLKGQKPKESRSYSIGVGNKSGALDETASGRYWTLPSGLAASTATGAEDQPQKQPEQKQTTGMEKEKPARRRAMSSFVEPYKAMRERVESSAPRESSLSEATKEPSERDTNRQGSTKAAARERDYSGPCEYSSVVKRSHVESLGAPDKAALAGPDSALSARSGSGKKQQRRSADFCAKPSSTRRNTVQAVQQENMQATNIYNIDKQNYAISGTGTSTSTNLQQTKQTLVEEKLRNTRLYEEDEKFYNSSTVARTSGLMGAHGMRVESEQSSTSSIGNRDEWFRQMYKQMHRQTPEKSLLQAVNSQQAQADTTQIRIKLKSPKTGKLDWRKLPFKREEMNNTDSQLLHKHTQLDHRCSPSYFTEEEFERRRDKNSVSPTFKPGNICDYLPGQSSISQHERNLVSIEEAFLEVISIPPSLATLCL